MRVVQVNPGYTATDRAGVLRKIAENKFGSAERWRDVERELNLPFGRMGRPNEVADVVTFLASPRASYVSGTVVTVDAGAAHPQRVTRPNPPLRSGRSRCGSRRSAGRTCRRCCAAAGS